MPSNEPATLGAEPVDSTHVSVGAVVVAILLTVGAGVAVSYGLARDNVAWLLGGAAVFAPVVVASTHGAARAVQENRRTAGTAACAGLGILFIVVIVFTQPWWGADHHATGPVLVLGASDPSAHVYLHGTPGGAELTRTRDPEPLVANTAYRFSCQVKLSDGSRWLRLADSDHWVPAFVFLTKSGRPAPVFPTC